MQDVGFRVVDLGLRVEGWFLDRKYLVSARRRRQVQCLGFGVRIQCSGLKVSGLEVCKLGLRVCVLTGNIWVRSFYGKYLVSARRRRQAMRCARNKRCLGV